MWSYLCDVEQSDLWTNLNFLPEPQIKFVLKFIRLIFLKHNFLHGIKEENLEKVNQKYQHQNFSPFKFQMLT